MYNHSLKLASFLLFFFETYTGGYDYCLGVIILDSWWSALRLSVICCWIQSKSVNSTITWIFIHGNDLPYVSLNFRCFSSCKYSYQCVVRVLPKDLYSKQIAYLHAPCYECCLSAETSLTFLFIGDWMLLQFQKYFLGCYFSGAMDYIYVLSGEDLNTRDDSSLP